MPLAALIALSDASPVRYAPAAGVLLLGCLAVGVCVRQRNPRVPFIAILALIVFVVVSAAGMLVGFGPRA